MIFRIDITTTPTSRGGEAAVDPLGASLAHQIQELGISTGNIDTSRIFLIDSDSSQQQVQSAAERLLADPIVETAKFVTSPPAPNGSLIEVHLKPGVMDPVAASTEMALRDMGLNVREVRTGRAFKLSKKIAETELRTIASRVLANGVIESVHTQAYIPHELSVPHEGKFEIRHVPLTKLNDPQLTKLSRDAHLFLSLAEMQAIQNQYRKLNREPSDIELETIAQTWSEHCVHKTLKSAVEVVDESGAVVRKYDNLIKRTIFESTQTLMEEARRHPFDKLRAGEGTHSTGSGEAKARSEEEFCLSVFKDNAGVIAFDDTDAVCFKVETHNHPSAIEPYGGAATGAGGCIRDVMGTGLSAKPIANTDIFCVAYADAATAISNRKSQISNLPKGVIHPKRILQQVVAGVRDYGNRMGIPTINGAVYFDDRYLANPLVFCGCVGIIPRNKINKETKSGDAILVMGGRTGRDGIHGATFSSAELTDTHADEFSHAVQIGNAITQKKMLDVILQARDKNLFTAITDCGAGGLSSAVGEMGEKLGAEVHLDRVPLKYAGLRYDEIWISEAQERMVLSVPQQHVEEILKLSRDEDVEATVIGTFGTQGRQLKLLYRGTLVGEMSMEFLHDGIPMPTRRAVVKKTPTPSPGTPDFGELSRVGEGRGESPPADMQVRLLALLSHPNIASKHWIIRQYDHEVQGTSIIKPLVGPMQTGPSDAAVIRPKLNSTKGVVISCGMVPSTTDPYEMAIASIDEAVRNAVAVGADPSKLAILDNFCWPSVGDEKTMSDLVAACEACRDAALAYKIPFISGKDSLNNQFTNSETGEVLRIPNTLLISAIGVIEDVRRCITMDLKRERSMLCLISPPRGATLEQLAATHHAMAKAIAAGHVLACHDVSEGGAIVAAAEMSLASNLGVHFTVASEAVLFDERVGCYIAEIPSDHATAAFDILTAANAIPAAIADVTAEARFVVPGNIPGEFAIDLPVEKLRETWRKPLDW